MKAVGSIDNEVFASFTPQWLELRIAECFGDVVSVLLEYLSERLRKRESAIILLVQSPVERVCDSDLAGCVEAVIDCT